jgi:hypothetical protein
MRSVLPWFVAALLASSGCGSGSNIGPVPRTYAAPKSQQLADFDAKAKLSLPPTSGTAIPVAPMPREVVR